MSICHPSPGLNAAIEEARLLDHRSRPLLLGGDPIPLMCVEEGERQWRKKWVLVTLRG